MEFFAFVGFIICVFGITLMLPIGYGMIVAGFAVNPFMGVASIVAVVAIVSLLWWTGAKCVEEFI